MATLARDDLQRAGDWQACPQAGRDEQLPDKDAYAKFLYDTTKEPNGVIIDRVSEIADKRGVSMTEVSLAWLPTKVTAPVVGATKFHHIEGR